MDIIKQRLGKTTYNGERIYVQDTALSSIGLDPGCNYETRVDAEKNTVVIYPDFTGNGNKVSSKTLIKRSGEVQKIPVIDKQGSEIKKALSNCSAIKISFVKASDGDHVIIVGVKNSATVLKETTQNTNYRNLTFLSLFAGTGIGSSAAKRTGMIEKMACEYNPNGGAEDRFANIFMANHPDTVMFNIPVGMLSPDDIPKVDIWFCTPPCTDFSVLSSTKSEEDSMHQFMYIMKLFWGMNKEDRPIQIVVENTPTFGKVAGTSLTLALKDEGYYVVSDVLNSLDFGSRTERKRYFLVASIFEGYKFPEPTGRKTSPIIEDGIITLDNLDFVTPETDGTLKHFVERNDSIKHNHKIRSIDITKDTHFGTIPKSHHKKIPENLVKHPDKDDVFAFLSMPEHLMYLHGIDPSYYLGESRKAVIEAIGQGVDCHTIYALFKSITDFLKDKLFGVGDLYKDLPLFQQVVAAL